MTGKRGHASTVPGGELAAVIRTRHDALRSRTGAARAGDVDGVHQARVASRRLREVIPVLGTGLTGVRLKPLRRRLRDLTQALGPVRELDVALGMVADLPLEDDDDRQLREAWVRLLAARRQPPARALRKALTSSARKSLDAHLDDFAEARAGSDDQSWRLALASRLASRARDLRDCIERTGALFHPEPLHEVRIAGKKLRYALEMAAETGLVKAARPLATLKNAQEALGRLHDLDVLVGVLREVPEAAPGEPLQDAATRVAAALDNESRWLHARYLRARVALLRVTDTTLDTVVVRVHTAGRPARRPVDASHAC